ncbi:MAG TPA: dihydrolipoyl dehydrogenase [Luteibaculaceae bacterium]|nr:dihydrolipoyl dehydrogenase [Luteibaculaceae bacterium]
MASFDVVVIGSGPGGYVCAIRCAQLGLKTALVEKYDSLGGTCLNVGCIPSKALLDSSEHYHNALENFAQHGIVINKPAIDFGQMIKRKQTVIDQTVDGLKFLMKKNKIEVFHGVGSFATSNSVTVTKVDGTSETHDFKHAVIATGSKPSTLPGIAIDKKRIITSTEALSLPEVPGTMVIIGGGVIGLELGSVYARLGTKVQVVEYFDSIIPSMDRSLGKELQRVMKKNLGVEFFLSHKVLQVTNQGDHTTVTAENQKGETVSFQADYTLVCVGRKAYTEGLNAGAIGIEQDQAGRIQVNEHLQTSVKHIYAIGDVVKGPMLAHKAEEEGTCVAEMIAGQKPHLNYLLVPGVVYTWPEVASVGYTEEQLKEQKREYKSGQFPFRALGRARASMDIDGFVKVLADKTTDEVLGVHMIGPRVADIIAEAAMAMEYRASAEDISRICHAHPTFTEALKEAALDATDKRALHM